MDRPTNSVMDILSGSGQLDHPVQWCATTAISARAAANVVRPPAAAWGPVEKLERRSLSAPEAAI